MKQVCAAKARSPSEAELRANSAERKTIVCADAPTRDVTRVARAVSSLSARGLFPDFGQCSPSRDDRTNARDAPVGLVGHVSTPILPESKRAENSQVTPFVALFLDPYSISKIRERFPVCSAGAENKMGFFTCVDARARHSKEEDEGPRVVLA